MINCKKQYEDILITMYTYYKNILVVKDSIVIIVLPNINGRETSVAYFVEYLNWWSRTHGTSVTKSS